MNCIRRLNAGFVRHYSTKTPDNIMKRLNQIEYHIQKNKRDLDFEKYRTNTLETQYKYIITSRLEKLEHQFSRSMINFRKILESL